MKRAIASIALVSGALLASCSTNPQEHLTRGADYLEQKKYPEAIVELRTAVQADPKLAEARLKLADAYLATGEGGSALRELVRAADLLPDDAAVQLKTGGLLLQGRMYADARGRAERVLARDPKNVDAYVLKGNALAGLREFKAAMEEYDRAITTDPTRAEPLLAMGSIQMAQGNAAEAEQALLKAVELDPRSMVSRLALGGYYWAAKNWMKAEDVLQSALELEPGSVIANRAMGMLLMATGRAPQAEPYFVRVAKESPTTETAAALAQYYVATGRRPQARQVLTDLAARDDAYADASVRLALLEISDGDRAAASRRVDEVLARFPTHLGALVLSANLALDAGKLDEATEAVTAALAASPDLAAAHEVAGKIHVAAERRNDAIKSFEAALRSNPTSFAALLALAHLHLETAPDKSLAYARQAAELRPGNNEARAVLARNYLRRNDVDRARPIVAELKKGAATASTENIEAGLHLIAKRPEAARTSYERALALDPVNLEALNGLLRLDLSRGRTADAIKRVEARLAKGRDVAALVLAAQTYTQIGNATQAERLLLEAVGKQPDRAPTYATLGLLYRQQGRVDDAIKQFEQVRQRDPQSVPASTMLAMLHEERGDKATAEKEYQRVLSINSRAALAANNLAWLYVSSNRNLEQALELAQIAHQEVPDDPRIADTLGWIYVRKNLASLGIPHLESSAGKLPNDPGVHYHLGAAYLQTGDRDKAGRALKHALSLGADFDGAAEARKALEQLGT